MSASKFKFLPIPSIPRIQAEQGVLEALDSSAESMDVEKHFLEL